MVEKGLLTNTKLGAISTLMSISSHVMQALIEDIDKIIRITEPIKRICETLDSKGKIEFNPDLLEKTNLKYIMPEKFKGLLEFKNIEFAFPTLPDKHVLNDVSFKIKPGMKVAFVGTTGCGKSTTFKLLKRFYNQNEGEITLDGHQIQNYCP